jgi:hypothetical protein
VVEVMVGSTGSVVVTSACVVVVTLAGSWWSSCAVAGLAEVTPARMRGRVVRLLTVAEQTMQPIGSG